MAITRLFDLLPNLSNFPPKKDFLALKMNGKWKTYSYIQYQKIVNSVSYGLMKLGVNPGDKVATISPGRPEWNFMDMATLQIGAIHVPIYPTISEEDYRYILEHAEVKVLLVVGREVYRKIENFIGNLNKLLAVFTIKETDGLKTLDELIEFGKSNPAPARLKEIQPAISGDDLATIIYTSGTTGVPKGVMLSHTNILKNIEAVEHILPTGPEGRVVSYLPLSHIYERMLNYTWHKYGLSIYYVDNLANIGDILKEVKPHIFSTVPRLLEKIYDKIMITGRKLKGIKRNLFFWAVDLGHRYEIYNNSIWYKAQLKIADKLVFRKWREVMGNNIKLILSGGAALQPRLARIFTAAGFNLLEGYGLTETSPIIAGNDNIRKIIRFGTVGKPFKGVEFKLSEEGEICSKGPCLMKGYYKDPEQTAQVIDEEGWFHTGDIAELDKDGYIVITGRTKEIFKTSLGKYISPELIENKFKESPFIDTMVVVGENQKFAAALIVPDFVHLKNWAQIKGIPYTTNEEMVKDPVIKKRFEKEISKYNTAFGATEQVRKFELIPEEWSIDSGELTATLKLRRKFIHKKYEQLISSLF